MPVPRGKKDNPTNDSIVELLPADWLPNTTIWGRESSASVAPSVAASCWSRARVSTTDGSPSQIVALLDGEDWNQVDEEDVENPLRPQSPSQLQGRRLKALARKCIERCQAEADRDERRNARLRSEEDRACLLYTSDAADE